MLTFHFSVAVNVCVYSLCVISARVVIIRFDAQHMFYTRFSTKREVGFLKINNFKFQY